MSAPERDDLLDSLHFQRELLLGTTTGLDDDQARLTPTVSTLSLGGLLKHVAHTERSWCDFVRSGPAEGSIDWEGVDWSDPPAAVLAQVQSFTLVEGETLADVVADVRATAEATDELVRTADLDQRWPLPEAPWFEPGATRSIRRVFLGLVGEISQHAGHADILRESIDGQKSMG